MALSVEWRFHQGTDAIVLVDPAASTVSEVATPDDGILKDYLAVTGDLERWRKWTVWRSVDGDNRDPESWGELVLGRADDGQVLFVDPELYWEAVRRRFLSRGIGYNT